MNLAALTEPVNIVSIASTVGLLLSGYIYFYDHQLGSQPVHEMVLNYNSKSPFTSSWSHPLSHFGIVEVNSRGDISLASIALVYYSLMSFYPALRARHGFKLALLSAVGSVVSVYLAYILKFELKAVCPICILLYLCNFLIFGALTAAEIMKPKERIL